MLYMAINRRNECAEIVAGMSPLQRKVKRAIDIVCAATGLVLFSPAFLVISLALKRQGDGPIFFSQERMSTKTERFLREHHLDELPQLWNVLVGEMSMVGPRPERQFFIDKISEADPRYKYLFKLRPGVTSEATLYNGYTDTMEKMLERLNMDLNYLENGTLGTDLSIMLKTFLFIATGKKNSL